MLAQVLRFSLTPIKRLRRFTRSPTPVPMRYRCARNAAMQGAKGRLPAQTSRDVFLLAWHLFPMFFFAKWEGESGMVTLFSPPNNQTVELASANQAGKKVKRGDKCIKRISAVNSAKFWMDMGNRPVAGPLLLVLHPLHVADKNLSRRHFVSDDEVQRSFKP